MGLFSRSRTRLSGITAIMKSVSPSAFILGPMTGIMMEAILLELVIMMFGNNLFGLILAGIASVSSALFHKLINLLIFYGFDLIQIYVNIVNFALKQFGLEAVDSTRVVDVMAKSFTSSALDMEKFAESMKFVGPAAKASGISRLTP